MSGQSVDVLQRKPDHSHLGDFRLHMWHVETGVLRLMKSRNWPPWRLGLSVPLGLIIILIVCAVQGTLLLDGGFNVIRADFSRAIGASTSQAVPQDFPLLRDTSSLAILTLLCLTLPHLARQWMIFESILDDFVKDGQILFGAHVEGAKEDIRRINRRFEVVASAQLVVFVFGLTLALIIVGGQSTSGVFGTFAPAEAEATLWAEGAYETWWASLENPLGFATYVIFAAIVSYYILLQNYVGFEFCIFILRYRNRIEISPDALNRDKYFGWEPLVRLLRTVVACMALTGATIAIFFVILPDDAYLWLLIPLLLWSLGAITYGATPFIMLSPASRRWKEKARGIIDGQVPEDGQLDATYADLLRAEYRKVNLIQIIPGWLQLIAGIGYAMPIGSVVLQLAR